MDTSHRDVGLWAIDTANPNAWGGAEEYLASSGADFVAFQETKVNGDAKEDKEAVARNIGWSTAIRPCCSGAGGGASAGVAVACRSHIGMMDSCEEDLYPSSLEGRFEIKKVGAICKGGVHLGSAYFHSSLGSSMPKT